MNKKVERVNQSLKSGLIKVEGLEKWGEELDFYCKNGEIIVFYHEQNCCESVYIESADSIENDIDIYTDCDWCEMEVVSSENEKALSRWEESYTWTFYKFKTNKGYDTIRWYGRSNGYYSEKVSCKILKDNKTIEDFYCLGE